jgi:hypothetical protein
MADTPTPTWLSLEALAQIFGLSAHRCGRHLVAAGLRLPGGAPTAEALRRGAARTPHPGRPGRGMLWNRQVCGEVLEQRGLNPLTTAERVRQWADLLTALLQGSTSISITADQMAEDLPRDLVEPVNRQLQADGCAYRVPHHPHRRSQARRSASA